MAKKEKTDKALALGEVIASGIEQSLKNEGNQSKSIQTAEFWVEYISKKMNKQIVGLIEHTKQLPIKNLILSRLYFYFTIWYSFHNLLIHLFMQIA